MASQSRLGCGSYTTKTTPHHPYVCAVRVRRRCAQSDADGIEGSPCAYGEGHMPATSAATCNDDVPRASLAERAKWRLGHPQSERTCQLNFRSCSYCRQILGRRSERATKIAAWTRSPCEAGHTRNEHAAAAQVFISPDSNVVM